jgi:thiamine pyrophosphate-dependent acetolactate synthase large subunit-like protein
MRSYNPVVKGHLGQIKKAVHLLLEAKRPMIYTGGGVILSQWRRATDPPCRAVSVFRSPIP